MPAVPEQNWTQLGWKVWTYDGTNINTFSSKTHTWDQVPQDGVQGMYRYYSRPSSYQVYNEETTGYDTTNYTKKWREGLSGQDFYLEKDIDKDLLPRVATFFKIGSLDENHLHTAITEFRNDSTHPVDNSITAYEDTKKTLIGWKVWVAENDALVSYSSDIHTWTQVPTFGVLMMNKYWKSGPSKWIENVIGQDIYYLNNDDQTTLKTNFSFLKNGSVISEVKLSEINQLMASDTEVF